MQLQDLLAVGENLASCGHRCLIAIELSAFPSIRLIAIESFESDLHRSEGSCDRS
ncbi:hypothetical protein SAMN05444065_13718 [Pseudomonas syringae]|uniref:Uncharacterized protein n=1 Tax=Pseudomonas syringae TaxID=317 RepID=A0AB38C4X8_PSESX|nr:hypothetical protein SAMN05444065_13718 [Pseudomonas syringae]SFO94370.1 hypothetical protein SAMN05444063_1313 [Pseudomonas syringae]